jgi:hypothetical protein
MTKTTLYKKLITIQQQLKAPKNQYNSFGKYYYRSLEDILEAAKPLLKENELYLTMHDEIVNVGNHNYIKATVTLADEEGQFLQVSAMARESETKKGMDDAQITGSTSSYARKYALNGLFAIDDSKDADFSNTHGNESVTKTKPVNPNERTQQQQKTIKKLMIETRTPLEKMYEYAGITEGTILTKEQASKVITWLNGILDARGEIN